MEVFAGRWARAEPTAAARARVLKNMLAMICKSWERMENVFTLLVVRM